MQWVLVPSPVFSHEHRGSQLIHLMASVFLTRIHSIRYGNTCMSLLSLAGLRSTLQDWESGFTQAVSLLPYFQYPLLWGSFLFKLLHSAPFFKTLFGSRSCLEECVLVVWCDTAALTRVSTKWACVNVEKGLARGVQLSQCTHVIICCRAIPRLPSSRQEAIMKFHVTKLDAIVQFSGQMTSVWLLDSPSFLNVFVLV